jgi:hypothetical protein
MLKSTEAALRWFLMKEIKNEIFVIENRLLGFEQRNEKPPDETVYEYGYLRGLLSRMEHEVDKA